MGIGINHAALFVKAKEDNFCFDKILTIGNQRLYISQKQLQKLAARYHIRIRSSDLMNSKYAGNFFKTFLGAKTILSLDYSSYEGSEIIHDMNKTIDPKYHEAFDAVIDGGSLEHIFNVPVAIANCMNMVKKGGSLFIITPANNHTGHGFYQFSPELFFRIFRPENGFMIRSIILEKHPFPGAELSRRTKCFSVTDPVLVKSRVGLVTKSPVLIIVHAIRTEITPVLASPPIQSDYQSIYEEQKEPHKNNSNTAGIPQKIAKKAYALMPTKYKQMLNGKILLKRYSLTNGKFYKRWYPL